MVDGRLLHGATGNAGHIGHVIVEPDGAACACGAQRLPRGRGVGTVDRAVERVAPPPRPTPRQSERTGTLVGRGVASVVNLLDLKLALVGGSVALGMGDAFFTAAQGELDARSQISFARGARIRPVGLGTDGPLIGAACVAFAAGVPEERR